MLRSLPRNLITLFMNRRLKILITFCGLLGLLALFGKDPISRSITFRLLIRQDAPSALAMSEVLEETGDPTHRIQALWKTGHIPHRHIALRFLKEQVADQPDLLSKNHSLIWEATRDPDFSNRELALGIISETEPQNIKPLLLDLLGDRDQGTRLRALRFISNMEDKSWIPIFIELLGDTDPMVVAHTAAKLRRWTNQDFGVRMLHAIVGKEGTNADQPLEISQDQRTKLMHGVNAWREWWTTQSHKSGDSEMNLATKQAVEPLALQVEDFKMQTMKGKTLRLSDFKGKAVLLNFWTTWCASCMTEMPDLNWLHDQYPEDLQVIGISLDGDDGHGHEHSSIVDMEEAREKGWDAVNQEYGDSKETHDHDHQHDREHTSNPPGPDLEKIKKKIQRVIRKKELKYPIAMDPFSDIGKRFNGQELPTNVLIDAEGNLRRRFVGPRPIHSWQAMLNEIGVPAPKIPEQ